MTVFDDMIRTDAGPSKNAEALSVFLNRAAGPYWDQVRKVIEDWYRRYPSEERKDLQARLRDSNDVHVHAALWELYLHEMFVCSGFKVECHPVLSDTESRPDFLVFNESASFFVEARRLSGNVKEMSAEKRRSALFDQINKIDSPNFFLSLEILAESDWTPPSVGLKKRLTEWLSQLDPDSYINDVTSIEFTSLPTLVWKEQGWEVAFRALPKSPDKRGLPNRRAIGIYPSHFAFVDDSAPIGKALKVKGSKYGDLSAPYVVALATSSISHDEEDMEKSLFGTLVESVDLMGKSNLRRIDDGYWSVGDAVKHRGVSAILTVHNPAPWTWAKYSPSIWMNPSVDSLKPSSWPYWRQVRLAGVEIEVMEPVESIHKLLNLPDGWPVGEPFPRVAEKT